MKDIQGRLEVRWDTYWSGFMNSPLIEFVRFRLVAGAYDRLVRHLPATVEIKRICELGAGTGTMSKYLARRYSSAVVLVDSNAEALRLSGELFEGQAVSCQRVEKDVFDLEALHGAFDLVHSGGLIEHFIGAARREIVPVHCRLAGPGGRVIILVPVRNWFYRLLNEGVFRAFKLLQDIPEVPWSLAELEEALRLCGFRIVARTMVLTELGVLAERIAGD
ncbi:MAG: class I SAM-dependent methyltransferase [Candidatus Omnitrophica bacterium]|nr:class I SAM-dependent methyltransferase [Candidatus Omnitrophota bacterium]